MGIFMKYVRSVFCLSKDGMLIVIDRLTDIMRDKLTDIYIKLVSSIERTMGG